MTAAGRCGSAQGARAAARRHRRRHDAHQADGVDPEARARDRRPGPARRRHVRRDRGRDRLRSGDAGVRRDVRATLGVDELVYGTATRQGTAGHASSCKRTVKDRAPREVSATFAANDAGAGRADAAAAVRNAIEDTPGRRPPARSGGGARSARPNPIVGPTPSPPPGARAPGRRTPQVRVLGIGAIVGGGAAVPLGARAVVEQVGHSRTRSIARRPRTSTTSATSRRSRTARRSRAWLGNVLRARRARARRLRRVPAVPGPPRAPRRRRRRRRSAGGAARDALDRGAPVRRCLVARVAAALIASCFVDRRSNDFECETEAQCAGRPGLRAAASASSPPMRRVPQRVQRRLRPRRDDLQRHAARPGQCNNVDCPPGYDCTITLQRASAVQQHRLRQRRLVRRSRAPAVDACGSIDCGDGRCNVVCTDRQCLQRHRLLWRSCACDVTCHRAACEHVLPVGDAAPVHRRRHERHGVQLDRPRPAARPATPEVATPRRERLRITARS